MDDGETGERMSISGDFPLARYVCDAPVLALQQQKQVFWGTKLLYVPMNLFSVQSHGY